MGAVDQRQAPWGGQESARRTTPAAAPTPTHCRAPAMGVAGLPQSERQSELTDHMSLFHVKHPRATDAAIRPSCRGHRFWRRGKCDAVHKGHQDAPKFATGAIHHLRDSSPCRGPPCKLRRSTSWRGHDAIAGWRLISVAGEATARGRTAHNAVRGGRGALEPATPEPVSGGCNSRCGDAPSCLS